MQSVKSYGPLHMKCHITSPSFPILRSSPAAEQISFGVMNGDGTT